MKIKEWIENHTPPYIQEIFEHCCRNRNLDKEVGTLFEALKTFNVKEMTYEDEAKFRSYYLQVESGFNKKLWSVLFEHPVFNKGVKVVAVDEMSAKQEAFDLINTLIVKESEKYNTPKNLVKWDECICISRLMFY
jgi:hypothetical protein